MALDQFSIANGYVLTISNEDMYRLARLTASYRESKDQPISAKEMMALIAEFIEQNLVPFSVLRTFDIQLAILILPHAA
jgi:hypothetical protein